MDKHKTGMSYSAWISIPNFMVPYMECYDTIATRFCLKILNPSSKITSELHLKSQLELHLKSCRYLEANGKPHDPSTPFFINPDGGPLYHSKSWPINWGDFAAASGLTKKVTNYTFRQNMSQTLIAARKAILTECEEYALCHSAGTRQKYYSDEQANMAKSLLGQDYYQKKVAGEKAPKEASEKQSEISKRTKERHEEARRKLDNEKIQQMVLADMELSKKQKPVMKSNERTSMFGDYVKMALCDAIQQAGLGGDFGRPLKLTKDGNALDLFFTGKPMVNPTYAKYILRLITMVGGDHWSFKVLRESICSYTKLVIKKNPSLTAREISWKWAIRMLFLLTNMGRDGRQLTSPALMYIIGTTMVEKGSSKYNFGSKAIARQLRHWVLKEAERRGKPQPEEVLYNEAQHEREHQPEGEQQQEGGDQLEGEGPSAGPSKSPALIPKQRKRREKLTEEHKIHLLQLYLDHAPDLCVRDQVRIQNLNHQQHLTLSHYREQRDPRQ